LTAPAAGERLRVAVVGCGAMGARHARTIAADLGAELAVVVDVVPERAAALAAAHGCRAEAVVPHEVDAVVIATPTTTHADVGTPLLARRLWCLVEKPLAHSLEAARALRDSRCRVGHVERFNPAIRAAGAMSPVVVEGRRIAPPTGRGLDVDVILDLMIHDLDLVLAWARDDEVSWVDAAGVMHGRHVDTASVRLRTTGGLTASLVASRVAAERQRVLHCYEPGRCTRLDLLTGVAVRGVERLVGTDARDALSCQWAGFAAAARGEGGAPGAEVEDGLRAVELAERVLAEIRLMG
jgi:predicted dehydrogenase